MHNYTTYTYLVSIRNTGTSQGRSYRASLRHGGTPTDKVPESGCDRIPTMT